jgi:outer membrane protein TolC
MTKILATWIVLAAAIASADPKLDAKQLAADRIASATKLMESAQRRYTSGTATLADLERASLRVVDAALDGASAKDAATALREHAKLAHALLESVTRRHDAGMASDDDVEEMHYHAIEADLWAVRGKR